VSDDLVTRLTQVRELTLDGTIIGVGGARAIDEAIAAIEQHTGLVAENERLKKALKLIASRGGAWAKEARTALGAEQ
jgi:hypothetical protein